MERAWSEFELKFESSEQNGEGPVISGVVTICGAVCKELSQDRTSIIGPITDQPLLNTCGQRGVTGLGKVLPLKL